MKKLSGILMLVVVAFAMLMTGCEKGGLATVQVEVRKSGKVVPNEQVYMYRGNLQDAFLKHKVHASTNVATDENGIAEFSVPSLFFGIDSENQATCVFETFDENENITGKVVTSVKKGATKKVTLNKN